MDNDGMLDSNEIAGALSAATGMSIPVFIVKNSLGKFDTDSDEKLNEEELGVLWNRLGIEYVEEVRKSLKRCSGRIGSNRRNTIRRTRISCFRARSC